MNVKTIKNSKKYIIKSKKKKINQTNQADNIIPKIKKIYKKVKINKSL